MNWIKYRAKAGIAALSFAALIGFQPQAIAAPSKTTDATSTSEQDTKVDAKIDAFIDQFVQYMVKKHQFDEDYLYKIFDQVSINPIVTKKMDKPYEAKPWHTYKNFFVTDKRIQNGLKYWQTHEKTLKRAESEYGVSPSVIVAILGVETNYGERQGGFPVIESLSTLAFNYPSRSAFFKKELEHFLLLTREQKLDPLKVMGSYAGAIGMAQFMPSSYRSYAVDFSGKQQIDLQTNHEDAIGSIANYLKRHGWQHHGKIACQAKLNGTKYQELLPHPLKLQHTVKKLAKYGIEPSEPARKRAKTLLVELKNEHSKPNEYWVGFNNFYVISRYNHSEQYVMAVHHLAQEIERQREQYLAKAHHSKQPLVNQADASIKTHDDAHA